MGSRAIRLCALLLVIMLATSCWAAGSLAKYNTTASGSATARVAKWRIVVNGDDLSVDTDPSATFPLFETIQDSNLTGSESDVKPGAIAPGTSGKFGIQIANNSEVAAEHTLSFAYQLTDSQGNALTAPTIPLEYQVVEGSGAPSDSGWQDMNQIGSFRSQKAMEIGGAPQSYTVYWRWGYDGDDTAVGIEARNGLNATVTTTIHVEQVD